MLSIRLGSSRAPLLAALLLLASLLLAPAARAGVFDVDTTFGTQGVAAQPAGVGNWGALAVLADGRFVAAGQNENGLASVARFTADGQLDPTFAATSPTPGVVTVSPMDGAVPRSLLVLPDGRILLGATSFATATGSPSMLIARLSADGAIDPSFGSGGLALHGPDLQLGGIALDPAGRIVATGWTTTSPLNGMIERFNADGTLDGPFEKSVALGTTTRFDAVAVDPAGRIVVAGTRTFNGAALTQTLAVERFTAAGAPDPAFGSAGVAVPQLTGAPTPAYAVEGRRLQLDASGAVLVAATARCTSGTAKHLIGLARLTAAGTLDAAFGTGGTRTQDISPSGVADAADLVALPAGGGFAVVGGMTVGPTTQFALAAYHGDGTTDDAANAANTAFPNAANLAFGSGNSDRAAAVAVTPAGRLLVAGSSLGVHDAQGGVITRLGGAAGAPQAAFATSWTQAAPGRKARPGQPVTFDASASTSPNGPITSYEWDLDGNGSIDATGPKASKAYGAAGKASVLLRVTNSDGLTGTTGTTVDVEADQAPSVSFSINDGQPAAGEPVVLNVAGSDPDGTVTDYAFDLDGNGTYETDTGTSPKVSTVFAKSGTLPVAVRVTDDEGATGVATKAETVKPGACETAPQMKINKATFFRQTGEGCFHRVVIDKGTTRTTTWTTDGVFRVNGIQVETPNGGDVTITWKQELKKSAHSHDVTPGATTELTLFGSRARITGVAAGGTPFFFHTGATNWDLAGDTIKGFSIDPSAVLAGLPLKIKDGVTLHADATASMDVLPGLPSDLLGKTPNTFQTTVFGPTATLSSIGGPAGHHAALGAFTFEVDEIPLGVITLGPVKISYDGNGGWIIEATAQIPQPIAAKVKGKLVIVNGKVKSLDLNFQGHIPTPTPLVVTELGLNIDFGPKVAANPDCVKTVGLVETTPYENYKVLDAYAPFLRPLALAHPELYGSLFRKTYINYPTPKFALCGLVGVSLGEVLKGSVKFGFAQYSAQYPDLLFFQGNVTLVDFIKAQVSAEITTDGYVHFNAAVKGGYPNETKPWITWDLGFDFEYYQKKFNAQAWAKIGIPPIDFNAGANLLVSSKGIAACLALGTPFGTWRPGAGAKWGQSPTLYFTGCDVKDYKEVIKNALSGDVVIGGEAKKQSATKLGLDGIPVVSSEPKTGHGNDATLVRIAGTPADLATRQSLKARAAQAGPAPVEIPKGLPGTVLEFKGAGAPPHVILHAPGGQNYDTQSGNAPVQTPSFVAVKNTESGITEVLIAKPAGGTWTVEVAADSSRLVQALQADGTTGATVKGHAGGSGQNRTLSYDVQDLPEGGRVDFVEAGKGGALIGSASRSGSDTIAFHPAIGGAGPRDLQAIVYAKDGYVSRRIVLDSYRAPLPAAPKAASGLKVTKSGKHLVIRWKAQAGLASQRLDFRTSEGINVSRTLKRSQATMPLPKAGAKLKITVTAFGRGGIEGKPKTFTIRLPKAKKKKATHR